MKFWSDLKTARNAFLCAVSISLFLFEADAYAQKAPQPSALVAGQQAPARSLSARDLAFGTEQLKKLLIDRPAMRGFASPGDAVWNSAVHGFAGATCGHKVSWNPENLDKPPEYVSDHEWPSPPAFKCFIRIREKDGSGKLNSGEYLWSALFYEFYNLANAKEFEDVYQKSLTGSVSRADWITINTQLEYLAMKKTIAFYRNVWLPQMQARKLKSNSDYWENGWQETYEKWIQQYWSKTNYPDDYWGSYYDNSVVPYLEAVKKRKQEDKAQD